MMTKWQKFVQSGAFARSDNLSLFLDSVTSSGPTSFGIIVAIILFVIVNQIWRLALGGAWPSSPSKPLRFVYVNDNPPPELGLPVSASMYLVKNILNNDVVRSKYLGFAQSSGIAGQFLGVGPFLGQPNLIAKFLAECKSAGIRTSFMCAETSVIADATSSIQDTLDLIEKLDYSLWPESIQTNMEDNVKLGPNQDVSAYFTVHTDAQTKISILNAKHGANLRLSASVLWWWTGWGDTPNPPTVNYGGKVQPYGEALVKSGIDCLPQIYLNFTATWHKDVFPMWVGLAKGTAAQVFPAIWINRIINDPNKHGLTWIPSTALPGSQIEGKVLELAKLCTQAGPEEFGGMAVFDAVSYSAFVASPPK